MLGYAGLCDTVTEHGLLCDMGSMLCGMGVSGCYAVGPMTTHPECLGGVRELRLNDVEAATSRREGT